MRIQNPFRLGLYGGLGVLLAIIIGTAIGNLHVILTYVGAALFLALGIDPAVSWLEKRKLPRGLAIVIVLVVILAVLAGLVLAVIPVVSDQVGKLIDQIPQFVKFFEDQKNIRQWWSENLAFIDYDNTVSSVEDYFNKNVGSLTTAAIGTIGGIATGAFGGIIIAILTLYFVASLGSIKRGLYQLVPATKREKFIDISEQIAQAVGRYVVGQVSLGLANGILSFIFLFILSLFTGLQYYALLAFIAFLFSLIPLIGTITGSVIITLSAFLFSQFNPVVLITCAIYYLIYMQVEAYVLSPNIMNRAVKVPGVLVVVAALAGGTLLGILGALIAIPTAAAILLIVKQVIVPRQNAL